MVDITFIWHDCFVVETDTATLVFDFWKDPLAAPGTEPLFLDSINPVKPLCVFVSHHHKDHFNKAIFSWQKRFPNAHYFISRDTAKMIRHMLRPESLYNGYRPAPDSVRILRPGEEYSDNILTVKAFGSTDTGNSWLVECSGKTFFHAGDLNAWVWIDESTPKEVEAAIRDFRQILEPIKAAAPVIDYAMFPVDSRIGSRYWTGASIFVRELDVRHFFPMHTGLGETPEQQRRFELDATRFEEYANPERGEYIALLAPGARYRSH